MELQQDERRALITLAFEKSNENIQAAKCLLNNEIPSKAASAAYFPRPKAKALWGWIWEYRRSLHCQRERLYPARRR